MNAPQIVWTAVGATTAIGLLVVVIGLFRQIQRLGRAVGEFGKEVRPALDELRAEAERAQEHSDRLAAKGQELRDSRR
jgi:Sec-independent protein translocase protein TatA